MPGREQPGKRLLLRPALPPLCRGGTSAYNKRRNLTREERFRYALHPLYQLVSTLTAALEKAGFDTPRAARLADVFARNSLEGVYSHGVNRFPRFLGEIENGIVRLDTRPETVASLGGMEVWDGRFGPGPLIAKQAMGRAVALAAQHGIACV